MMFAFVVPKLFHNINGEYVIHNLHLPLCLFFENDENFYHMTVERRKHLGLWNLQIGLKLYLLP